MARCWSRQAKDTVKVRFRAQAANAVRERGLVGWGRGEGEGGGNAFYFVRTALADTGIKDVANGGFLGGGEGDGV